jgi:hypothetical protein
LPARSLRVGLFLLAAATPAAPLSAQDPPPAREAVADTVAAPGPERVRPRTAMIRSWLFPGWGQASVDAYLRGGFFFGTQTTSWYMLLKTMGKLSEARAFERVAVGRARDSLRTLIDEDPETHEALLDPSAFERAVNADPDVEATRALVASRRRHRQDWITYTLFLTLASGLDAFVAAHLADPPPALTTGITPDGAVQLRIDVPVGRRR